MLVKSLHWRDDVAKEGLGERAAELHLIVRMRFNSGHLDHGAMHSSQKALKLIGCFIKLIIDLWNRFRFKQYGLRIIYDREGSQTGIDWLLSGSTVSAILPISPILLILPIARA